MKPFFALIPILATCGVLAGQPLHRVLQLRTIEVSRCEAVSPDNVAEVSRFVRAPSRAASEALAISVQVADSVPGVVVEGLVRQQRDLSFSHGGRSDPVKDTQWVDAGPSAPSTFFVAATQAGACEAFVPGQRVNVVLSQRAECDTYPPAGICAFDQPIRQVDPQTWTQYGR